MNEILESRQEYKAQKSKTVTIEQYFDPEIPNLGLEKYGMSLMDDGGIVEDLGYTKFGNQIRYITGLDVHSKSVKDIEDPVQRDAVINEINKTVEHIEKVLGAGALSPTNADFWSTIKLEIRGIRKYLDLSDVQDLVLYHCIKGGGFAEVAPSFEVAKNSPTKVFKFYLQELEEIAAIKTEIKKERNAARAELEKIRTKDPGKLFKVAKVVLTADNQFRYSTPIDHIYDKLDDFIEGTVVKTNKKKTPADFMAAAKLDKATLNLRAIVIDAIYYKFILLKSDNTYYNIETSSAYGRNLEEVIAYLGNPINSTELENISSRVEAIWNK